MQDITQFSKTDMNPQQIIIENIKNSYKISSSANESDKENFQALIGKLHRSLTKLAEDLYSKETHFVLELIQNADDNEYDHPEPLLKFIIDEENILIQNNEKGFTEKHVRALCDVGQSTKSKKLGYIGEKGIGFKSVFRVTDAPQIFSNGFHFNFRRNDEENNLGYIVPHWIENPPESIDENLTNILLPLKDDAKEHQLKFQEIEPELLLFLQKLSVIEIYTATDDSLNKYHKITENGLVKIKTAQSENHYKLIPKPLQVPETIQEEKRDLKETKLILGFPVTEKGSALINNDQKIFAFLPTRSYGFKFIIQADFLVPTSREAIHEDKKWNKWLRDNIANVFLESVEDFKEDDQLKTTFYNYIPTENEVKDGFFSVAVKQLHNKLIESECILTESGKWLEPSKIFRATDEIRSLITNDDLKIFFDKEYISTAVKNNADNKVLELLGISSLSVDNLIECLKNTEWLANQTDEWFIELYSYFEKQSLGKQRLERIKKLKIIKLTNNELASPAEQKIFFPLNKKQNYGFEKRIPFINKKTLALNNKEEAGRIENFLQSIDVFKAQPFEIIENYILADYENNDDGGWKARDKELLLGYIRYIKNNLSEYEKESDKRLNSQKNQWQTKTDHLERFKKRDLDFDKKRR